MPSRRIEIEDPHVYKDPLDCRRADIEVRCHKDVTLLWTLVTINTLTEAGDYATTCLLDNVPPIVVEPMPRFSRKRLAAILVAELDDLGSLTRQAIRRLCQRRGYRVAEEGDHA
jgi:hypothetical protein